MSNPGQPMPQQSMFAGMGQDPRMAQIMQMIMQHRAQSPMMPTPMVPQMPISAPGAPNFIEPDQGGATNPLASVLGNAGGAVSPQGQGNGSAGGGNGGGGIAQIINAMKSAGQVNGTPPAAGGDAGGIDWAGLLRALGSMKFG